MALDPLSFHVHHPYVLTFGKDSLDVWRIKDDPPALAHVCRLSEFVHFYGIPDETFWFATAIDLARELVIVPDWGQGRGPPAILVFSITDGQLQRKLEMVGHFGHMPMKYADGLALVGVVKDEEDSPPHGLTVLHVCDVTKDDWLVGKITLPERLIEREAERLGTTAGVLAPVFLTATGDVVATSSRPCFDKMDVLSWHRPHTPRSSDADASFEMETRRDNSDLIYPLCTAPLDETNFLLAVFEGDNGLVPAGDWCQTVIYAIDYRTLTVRWTAKPIGGIVRDIRYIPTLDAIVVIGKHDHGGDECDLGDGIAWDPYTFVAMLDPATGSQRRMEEINYRAHGTFVKCCAVDQSAQDPTLAVMFWDGTLCVVDVEAFVEEGFPRREDGRLRVESTLQERRKVRMAVVAERTVVIWAADGSGSSQIQCVSW